ncbi:MAG: hypothetical protein AAFV72_05240 [Cyanobacteria bacterium J06635_1]
MKWLKSKGCQRVVWLALGLLLGLLGYGLLQLIEPVRVAPIVQATTPVQFAGRALLVASDADMVATAYADGQLDRVPGIEDALTVVGLPLNASQPSIETIQVSNSVMSWPQIMAVSPNGQRAYVAEVRSRPEDNIQGFETIEDMPAGNRISIVNIENPAAPELIASVPVGRNPKHLSISPDGQLLAVDLEDADTDLSLFQINPDGTLGQRSDFAIAPDLPLATVPTATVWHPSGQFLAITTNGEGAAWPSTSGVAFYKVIQDNQALRLDLYSEPLLVGNHLSHARFSADGRFLLVPDLKWQTRRLRALSYLLNPRGEMIAIHFDPASGKAPEIADRAEVGLSPEGFAVSPDNSLIVTVNMRRTYLGPRPVPAWRGKPHSSLSLLAFDPTSGALTPLDEYGFEGLLPEQATFDADGKAIAVVIYNYREPSPTTGAVEFWRVVAASPPRLERTGFRLDVVRGAHDIVLVSSSAA